MQDEPVSVEQSTPLAYILKYTSSQNAFLRQAAIIYGATTDVITPKVAHGPSAATAYFGAFLSSLEEASKRSKPDETLLGALSYLILQIYPCVNDSVVVSLTEQVSSLFISILKKHASVSYVAKNLLGCLSFHIRTVSLRAPSRIGTIIKMIQALLVFSVDPRPKIRKDAQKDCEKAYADIAKANPDLTVPKQFEDVIVQFVKLELESCDNKNCQSALHLCGLLQSIIYYLSLEAVAKIMAPLLHLTSSIGNPYLLIQTCLTIDHLFLKGFHVSILCSMDTLSPTQSTSAVKLSPFVVEHLTPYVDSLSQLDRSKKVNKDSEFAAQLLTSLIELHTNVKDPVSVRAFDVCVLRVYTILHHLNPSRALQLVLKVLSLCQHTILSDNSSIRQSSSNLCRSVAKLTLTAPQLTIAQTQPDSVPAQVIKFLNDVFTLPHTSLNHPISIIEAAMEHATVEHVSLFSDFLVLIDSYHKGADANPSLQQYCEDAIARAMISFGPEYINTLLPINFPTLNHPQGIPLVDQLEESRPWILHVMAKNVRLAKLAYFRTYLLPHANMMLQHMQTSLKNNKFEESKVFHQFLTLVWDTLPAFAMLPVDVETEIKPLMKELVAYYTSEELSFTQVPICKALRVLAAKNLAIAEGRWGQGNDLGIQPLNVNANAHLNTTRKFKLTQRTRTEDVIKAEGEEDSEEDSESGDDKKNTSSSPADGEDSDDDDSEEGHMQPKQHIAPPISIEQAQKNVTALGSISKNILPLLFNTVLEIFDQDVSVGDSHFTFLPIILDTILAFSFVTPNKTRTQLFTRAFENFVETTKEMNSMYAQIESGDDDKDDDDNMTVFEAMSKTRPTMADLDPLTRKARGLCDILISLAPSLDMTCTQLLLKAVMVHFNSFSDVLQKKAYQTVAQILTLNRASFDAFWLDVLKGLTLSAANLHASSSKTRLALCKIIFCLVPQPLAQPDVMKTMPALVSEAILSIKESNAKVRETAFETIVGIAYNILNSSPNEALGKQFLTQYITMVLAGLAANTPRMLSATITVVARLIYEFRGILEQSITAEIFQTIIIMLPSRSREVLKAVLGLIKVAILSLDTEALRPHVRELLYTISEWSPDIKSRFKRKVRLLYTFLMRRFGVEFMRTVTPADDSRLIEYLRKMHARIQKQKTQQLQEKQRSSKSSAQPATEEDIDSKYHNRSLTFDDLLTMDDDDDDSDDMGDGSASDFLSKSVRAREAAADKKKGKRGEMVHITDDTDFLEPSVSAKLAQRVKPSSTSDDIVAGGANGKKRKSVQLTTSGKIDLSNLEKEIIEEHQAKKQAQRQPSKHEIELERKRKRELLKERKDQLQQLHLEEVKQRLGTQFASTRAAGDIKRKGQKYDPFAYVPLDPRNLNQKKKSFKAQVETFSGMFAKSGSKLGQKLKRSQRAALKKKGGRFKKVPDVAD